MCGFKHGDILLIVLIIFIFTSRIINVIDVEMKIISTISNTLYKLLQCTYVDYHVPVLDCSY